MVKTTITSLADLGIGKRAEGGPSIPETGEGFAGGFIAPVLGGLYYRLWADVDHADYNEGITDPELLCPNMQLRQEWGSGWRYYYTRKDDADKAVKCLGSDNSFHQLVWHLHAPVDGILNLSDEGRAKFDRPFITGDVMVTGTRSKNRHCYHLIFLPKLVSAMAKVVGYNPENVEFDISELSDRNSLLDDNTYAILFGAKAANKEFDAAVKAEMENGLSQRDAVTKVRTHWVDIGRTGDIPLNGSEYYWRRAFMYEALGESNLNACRVQTREKPGKNDATSDVVINAINFVESEWGTPIYCRFETVRDPGPGAAYVTQDGENRRSTMPVITEIFASAEAAQAAAGSDEDEAEGKTTKASVSAPASTGKAIPAEWQDDAAEFEAMYAELIAGIEGKPAPLQTRLRAKVAGDLGITEDELAAYEASL